MKRSNLLKKLMILTLRERRERLVVLYPNHLDDIFVFSFDSITLTQSNNINNNKEFAIKHYLRRIQKQRIVIISDTKLSLVIGNDSNAGDSY